MLCPLLSPLVSDVRPPPTRIGNFRLNVYGSLRLSLFRVVQFVSLIHGSLHILACYNNIVVSPGLFFFVDGRGFPTLLFCPCFQTFKSKLRTWAPFVISKFYQKSGNNENNEKVKFVTAKIVLTSSVVAIPIFCSSRALLSLAVERGTSHWPCNDDSATCRTYVQLRVTLFFQVICFFTLGATGRRSPPKPQAQQPVPHNTCAPRTSA